MDASLEPVDSIEFDFTIEGLDSIHVSEDNNGSGNDIVCLEGTGILSVDAQVGDYRVLALIDTESLTVCDSAFDEDYILQFSVTQDQNSFNDVDVSEVFWECDPAWSPGDTARLSVNFHGLDLYIDSNTASTKASITSGHLECEVQRL